MSDATGVVRSHRCLRHRYVREIECLREELDALHSFFCLCVCVCVSQTVLMTYTAQSGEKKMS